MLAFPQAAVASGPRRSRRVAYIAWMSLTATLYGLALTHFAWPDPARWIPSDVLTPREIVVRLAVIGACLVVVGLVGSLLRPPRGAWWRTPLILAGLALLVVYVVTDVDEPE